jgi:hypothetical protein
MNAILWTAVVIFVLGIGFSLGFVLRGIMGENMSQPMPLPPISQPPPPPPDSGPNA